MPSDNWDAREVKEVSSLIAAEIISSSKLFCSLLVVVVLLFGEELM